MITLSFRTLEAAHAFETAARVLGLSPYPAERAPEGARVSCACSGQLAHSVVSMAVKACAVPL